MKRTLTSLSLLYFLIMGFARAADDGAGLIRGAGVKGGLVVHLGAGDGKLTAALRVSDSYLVQGVERDAGKVAAARAYIRGQSARRVGCGDAYRRAGSLHHRRARKRQRDTGGQRSGGFRRGRDGIGEREQGGVLPRWRAAG